MPRVEFDIRKDNTHPCYCLACLVGKRQGEMSEDTRYCQNCFDFLSEEAKLIGSQRPAWIPKKNALQSKIKAGKVIQVKEDTDKEKRKLLTVNKNTVIGNNLEARGRQKTYRKQELPVGFIKQLFREGNGLKAIASRLKREKDIKVSHMTIGRVLSGERTA